MQKQITPKVSQMKMKDYLPRERTAAWMIIKLLAANENSPRTSGELARGSGRPAKMIMSLLNRLRHHHKFVYQGVRGSGYVLTKKGTAVARALGFAGTKVSDKAPAGLAHAKQVTLRVPHVITVAAAPEGLFAEYFPAFAAERVELVRRIEAIDAFAQAWLALRSSDGKKNGAPVAALRTHVVAAGSGGARDA